MTGTCGNPACARRTPDPICWECTRTLAITLTHIPNLANLLTLAARVVHNSSDGTGRSHYPPLPFDAEIVEFSATLHNLLVERIRDLCETRGIVFVPVGYERREFVGPLESHVRRLPSGHVVSVGEMAMWLNMNLDHLRMCESAGETFVDIHRAVDRGRALIDGHAIPVYRGPCPTITGTTHRGKPVRCDNPLYAPRGESFIRCRRCNTDHDAAQLEQRHLSDMSQMLFRFTRLQAVLRELGEPVTDRTLSAWIRTTRVKPAGWQRPDGTINTQRIDQRDRPLYRLADVRRVRAESRAVKGSTA